MTNALHLPTRANGNGTLTGFMSAEDVCEALAFKSDNPVDYCSHLARRGLIVAVPGRRATYTRESVMQYIEKSVQAARLSRASRKRRGGKS